MFPSQNPRARRADLIVHAISFAGFVAIVPFFLQLAQARPEAGLPFAIAVYGIAVLSSVAISGAYHLFPRHELRPTLRRWDHAAIYPVIAGTFTPLLLMAGTPSAFAILAVMWLVGAIGIVFKMIATNMDPKWSLASYIGFGAIGMLALPDFWMQLPRGSMVAIGLGAMFYLIGTWFYRQKQMPFRYPIWHVWGTLGGGSMAAAIWIALRN